MNNFESLSQEELLCINGGGEDDRSFGRELGTDIAKAAKVVWENTIGCKSVY